MGISRDILPSHNGIKYITPHPQPWGRMLSACYLLQVFSGPVSQGIIDKVPTQATI